MRGSIYYQTAVLTRQVFVEGAKKIDRINSDHPHYLCVASFQTMESYRSIWNNLGGHLKSHWNIKDFEAIESTHIKDYCQEKITGGISKQYAEKINSAIGKLEIALNRFNAKLGQTKRTYDFSIRQEILDQARKDGILVSNYHSRAYNNPHQIIEHIDDPIHNLAATIQLESGTRFKGVRVIKSEQLKGIEYDQISEENKGVIATREKGGKEGDIMVSTDTYMRLEHFFEHALQPFALNYQTYSKSVNTACDAAGETRHGCHGFRWNFAKRRIREYQDAGFSFDGALQYISWEMKHGRASISNHYLGS